MLEEDSLGRAASLLTMGALAFGGGTIGVASFLIGQFPIWRSSKTERGTGFLDYIYKMTHGVEHAPYEVQKRSGGEWHDVRKWITPDIPKVREYASALYDSNEDNYILNCWEWVCHNFNYKAEWKDLWTFPEEMLEFHENAMAVGARATGDCEDTSFLLASLLLAGNVNAYANVGYLYNTKHAWVTVVRNGQEYILETTLTDDAVKLLLDTDPWVDVESCPEYVVLYKFNSQDIIELRT